MSLMPRLIQRVPKRGTASLSVSNVNVLLDEVQENGGKRTTQAPLGVLSGLFLRGVILNGPHYSCYVAWAGNTDGRKDDRRCHCVGNLLTFPQKALRSVVLKRGESELPSFQN